MCIRDRVYTLIGLCSLCRITQCITASFSACVRVSVRARANKIVLYRYEDRTRRDLNTVEYIIEYQRSRYNVY